MTVPYESQIVCHFFWAWGFLDARHSPVRPAALLGNMQNALDTLVGDVAINCKDRYVIVEFKRDLQGFVDEVAETSRGKPARAALYAHLRADDRCYGLSRIGHYGGYLNSNGSVRLQRYAHCAASAKTKVAVVDAAMVRTGSLHPMEGFDTAHEVEEFYRRVMKGPFNDDGTPLAPAPVNRYIEGTGLTYEQLQEYVDCMYQHLPCDDDGETAIIRITKGTGALVIGTTIDLCKLLQAHFDAAYSVMPTAPSPSSPTGT